MSHPPQDHIKKIGQHISEECSYYFAIILGYIDQPMEHVEDGL